MTLIRLSAWDSSAETTVLDDNEVVLFDGIYPKVYNGVAELAMTKTARVLVGVDNKQVRAFKKACKASISRRMMMGFSLL